MGSLSETRHKNLPRGLRDALDKAILLFMLFCVRCHNTVGSPSPLAVRKNILSMQPVFEL